MEVYFKSKVKVKKVKIVIDYFILSQLNLSFLPTKNNHTIYYNELKHKRDSG